MKPTQTNFYRVLALVTCFLPASHALATVVGSGTSASCTDPALRAAAEAGGVVTFNCGEDMHTIYLQSELYLPLPVTIDGGDKITLDGGGKHRVLSSNEGDWRGTEDFAFILRNITIQNGYAVDGESHKDGQGGGVRVGRWNRFIAENVNFYNNVSTEDTHHCVGGGGLYIDEGGTARVRASEFRYNLANNGGGMNNLLSDLTVTDTVFDGNQAMHTPTINQRQDCGGGGAVYIDGARYIDGKQQKSAEGYYEIRLENNEYTNNQTNHMGGAVFAFLYRNQKALVNGGKFIGNQAVFDEPRTESKGVAGAIWFGLATNGTSQARMYIQNSTFIGNHADKMGGALMMEKPGTIQNATFSGNSALNPDLTLESDPNNWRRGVGGAIVAGVGTEIINATIVYNRTGLVSGGVHGGGGGDRPTLTNSIVAYNSAENNAVNKQNCEQYLLDGGNNVQFPADSRMDCIQGQDAQDPGLQALDTNTGYHPTALSGVGATPLFPPTLTLQPAPAGVFTANQATPVTISGGQNVHLQTQVQPQAAHRGQWGRIFVAALYEPYGVFYLTNSGWQGWPGVSLPELQSYREGELLDAEDVTIYQGPFPALPGTVTLITGYAVDNVLYFDPNPMKVTVR